MGVQIKIAPVIEEYEIPIVDAHDNHTHFRVSVRQATTGDVLRHKNLFSEQTQIWEDENVGRMEVKRKWNPDEQARMQVFLTLSACDLETPEGKPLFTFAEIGGVLRLANEGKFQNTWDSLPYDIASEIHKRVVKTNKQWDYANAGEAE